MRTTVDIPDGMYRQLKSRAAREGSSTRALILRGVKNVLKGERRKAGAPVEVMTQPQAWTAYDRWLRDPRVEFVTFDRGLRSKAKSAILLGE